MSDTPMTDAAVLRHCSTMLGDGSVEVREYILVKDARTIERELRAEIERLRDALVGLIDAVQAVNSAQERTVVDPHALRAAIDAARKGGDAQ